MCAQCVCGSLYGARRSNLEACARARGTVRRFFKSEVRTRSFSVSPPRKSTSNSPFDAALSGQLLAATGDPISGRRGSLHAFQQDRHAEAISSLDRKVDSIEESLGDRLEKIEEVLQLLLNRDRPDIASGSEDGRDSPPSVHIELPPKVEGSAPAVGPPPPVWPPPSSSPTTPKQKPSPPPKEGEAAGRSSRVSFSEAEVEPPAPAAAAGVEVGMSPPVPEPAAGGSSAAAESAQSPSLAASV